MIRYSLATILILFTSTLLHGQRPKKLNLDESKLAMTVRDFRLVEIADARNNKDDIGFVQVGLLNSRRPVVVESFEQSIFDLMEPSFIGQNRQLVLRINALELSEWTTATRETGIASANITFIEKTGEHSYTELYTSILSNRINGIDVTGRTLDNLLNTLTLSIGKFLKAMSNDEVINKEISPIDLYLYDPPAIPMSQLGTDFKVYRHFIDFLNDDPEDHTGIKIVPHQKKLNLKRNGYPVDNIWGAQYNGRLYILLNKRFRLLNKGNDNYYMTLKDIDEGAAMMSGFLFGAIGGAIATSSSGKEYQFSIDPFTGQLNFQEGLVNEVEVKKESHDKSTIIEIDPYGKKKNNYHITLADGKSYIVGRGQFILTEDYGQAINVCLNENEICVEIELPQRPAYVRLILKKEKIGMAERPPYDRHDFLKLINLTNRVY